MTIALLIINIGVLIWGVKIISNAILMSRDKPTPIMKPLFKPKEHEETEEEKRLRILNENIENYNGTGEGQIKI